MYNPTNELDLNDKHIPPLILSLTLFQPNFLQGTFYYHLIAGNEVKIF